MSTFRVYCHISPNGKRYVGLTRTELKHRWENGSGYAKNEAMYADIKKFGWDAFEHLVLLETHNESEAVETESRLIEELDLMNPEKGYNLRAGDNGSFSPQSLERMSKSRKGNTNCVGRVLSNNTRASISESLKDYYATRDNPFKGKTHNEESRRKMSEALKARHSGRKVEQLDSSGNVIRSFDQIAEAAATYSIDPSAISKCCRGVKKTCGGHHWRYAQT